MEGYQKNRRQFIRQSAMATGMFGLMPQHMPMHSSIEKVPSNRAVWIAGFSQMWLRAVTAEQMVEKILAILKDVAPHRPDFVCLPELFPFEMIEQKYNMDDKVELSEKFIETFAEFSREYFCHTVCPVFTRRNGLNYNSAVFLNREGKQIGVYDKIHPTSGEIENGATPGALFQPVIPTEFGPVGAQICFDINWNDGWSMLQQQKAKIVFWPSAYDGGKMINTRAWEYKYVVATSTNQNNSKLCDISGETIAQTGIWNKYFFCAPVNLEKVFIHLYPYVYRFQDIYKKYGRKVNISIFHEEQWAIIESLSEEISVKEILDEFEILTHEEHILQGDLAQNKARS